MEGSIDNISSLPDSILHHILSFLVVKHAIQVSAASKRLNHVWTTLPYLDLGRCFFAYDSDVESNRERLTTFVEEMLMSRIMLGLSIMKFALHVHKVGAGLGTHLDRWMHLLVESNIKEFILEIDSKWVFYDLPPILLNAQSLHALTLSNCKLPCVDRIKLSSLQKLHLRNVFADEHILTGIMSVCRSLEDLEITHCQGFKRLEVFGLPQLKILVLDRYGLADVLTEEIVVDTPNLEKLVYYGGFLRTKITIVATPESRLKKIVFSSVHISSERLHDLISRLPLLEELYLSRLRLRYIEISSSSLKHLTLSNLFDYFCRGVTETTIDAPNLLFFKFEGLISSISLNNENLAIPEVNLRILDFNVIENGGYSDFCCRFMEFLHTFNHSEVVRLSCFLLENVIFHVETRLKLLAPLPNIKQLIVKGSFDRSGSGKSVSYVVPRLMDSLFWISPGLKILTIKDDNYRCNPNSIEHSIKFTFEKLNGNDGGCPACTNIAGRCWRHSFMLLQYDFKGVTLDAKVDRCLRKYFIDNAKLLKECVRSCGNIRSRREWWD